MAFLSARNLKPQIARRCLATAVSHGHDHGHGHGNGHGGYDLRPYDEVQTKKHPCWIDHPVAPVATYDDFPVPVLSFKEGYEKHQKASNIMLAVSIVAFVGVSIFVWQNDILSMKQGSPPKWYTQRKIGKGLGDI